jgi:membrane-bound metal-dependent hydrolase YbcI (DUF457 family)
MLLFAHLGLTLAAARCAKKGDLAFIALGSMLPDIIDKPLGLIAFGTSNMGRTFGHTLLFFLILAALALLIKKIWLYSLAGGVFAHLALDFMWNSPVILFWPILGGFPQATYMDTLSYLQMLILGLKDPMISLPELFGLAYVIRLYWEIRWLAVIKCMNRAKTFLYIF